MKHLLNNISQEEKNSIREQHSGGKEIIIENFNQMINKKLGDVPTYLTEESEEVLKNYNALIGYVIGLSDAGGDSKSTEYTAALNELRMYYESLRDGITPKPLSIEAKAAKKGVEERIVKLNDSQITQMEKNGGGKTRLYGNEDILKNYKALIGFILFYRDKIGGDETIERIKGFGELSIYYENLRDGITPKPLSIEAEAAKNIVEREIMKFKLNGAQIKKLENNGGGKTRFL